MKQRRWLVALMYSLGLCTSICTSISAHALDAHVHGVATLQITLEGNTLSLDLDSPLDNLVGFEHAPRTKLQKQAVQHMLEKLRQPETLFRLSPSAQCLLGEVQLSAPILGLSVSEKTQLKKDDDHAGLEAKIVFNCRTPSSLKNMEIKLFDAFTRLHQLDVQMAGPRGQSAAKLTPKQRNFSW